MKTVEIIKRARLAYSHSPNLGDQIQTLATEQFLGGNPISIERHELDKYNGDKCIMIMQGFFCLDNYQCAFPPSDSILPLFIGFHIEDEKATRDFYSNTNILEYLEKHAPIGCRDKSTMNFLKSKGIDAYFTRCLTLTFPKREETVKGDKVFFIDEPSWLKPYLFTGKRFKDMYKNGVFLTQEVDTKKTKLTDEYKRRLAIERLNLLKKEASLVVTSRLHIASPCVALGIPVVLIPSSYTPTRYEVLSDLIPIYNLPPMKIKIAKLNLILNRIIRVFYIRFLIDWSPKAVDIEGLKDNLIAKVKQGIEKIEQSLSLVTEKKI